MISMARPNGMMSSLPDALRMERWNSTSAAFQARSVTRRRHVLIGLLDLLELRRRAVDGGERRGLWFDHEADLLHLLGELPIGDGRAVPSEHVAVEEVPGRARFDARPDLGTRLDHALSGERLDGLAHRGAADLVDAPPLRLVGKQRSRGKFAFKDARADILRHLVMQVAASGPDPSNTHSGSSAPPCGDRPQPPPAAALRSPFCMINIAACFCNGRSDMRLIQLRDGAKRRVARIEDGAAHILDGPTTMRELALAAHGKGQSLAAHAASLKVARREDYAALLDGGHVLSPLDHADPAHCYVTGTGLTHLGGAEARNKMHQKLSGNASELTDSLKMFNLGLEGGKPAGGGPGVQPEWFYKGDGTVVARRAAICRCPTSRSTAARSPRSPASMSSRRTALRCASASRSATNIPIM